MTIAKFIHAFDVSEFFCPYHHVVRRYVYPKQSEEQEQRLNNDAPLVHHCESRLSKDNETE